MNGSTEDLRNTTQKLLGLSEALHEGLSGHEQEDNAHQLKICVMRLRNIIAPIVGPKVKQQPKYTIFNSIHNPPNPSVSPCSKRKKFDADILVVEDQRYHQIVAKEILSMLGCRTQFVDNSEDAIIAMLTQRYDLILLDIDINGASGIDVAKRYRQEESFEPQVPLVAMTSMTSPTTRDNCRTAGMNAIAEKPYEIEKLLDILPHFLQPTVNA